MKKSRKSNILIASLFLFSLLFILSSCGGDSGSGSGLASDAKDITAFNFLAGENGALSSDVTGTVNATTVVLTVPYGTDVSALVPDIAITGESVDPADGAAVDFTSPVIYTVTAADSTTKDYTVTVTGTIPVAHWTFDEGVDTTAGDSAGSNDGTLSGAVLPQWIGGWVGDYALEFNNSSDYVSVPHNEDFNSQDFTVTAWLANYNPGTTSAYFRRIGGWHLRTTSNGWDIDIEGGDIVNSRYDFPESEPADPEWHHYAITVSSPANGSEVIFYVDGVQVGPIHTYTNGFSDSVDAALYIGQYSPGYNWDGAMDDVRFYNEVLTAQEILGLHNLYPIP